MKIFTRIVMDMTQDDLPVIEAECHEYSGPVALCWGNSGPGQGGPGNDGAGPDSDGPGGGVGSSGDGSRGDDNGRDSGIGGLGGNHGYGGYGDPDSPGSRGSGTSGSRGGSSASYSGGGSDWGNSPHGNPHGHIGQTADAYGGMSSGLSNPGAHRGMANLDTSWGGYNMNNNIARRLDIQQNPGQYGLMDRVGNVLGGLYHSGTLGFLGNAVSPNPIGFANAARNAANYTDAYSEQREQRGLPAIEHTPFDPGAASPNTEGTIHQATGNPAAQRTSEELRAPYAGATDNPLEASLEIAYQRSMSDAMQKALASVLGKTGGVS